MKGRREKCGRRCSMHGWTILTESGRSTGSFRWPPLLLGTRWAVNSCSERGGQSTELPCISDRLREAMIESIIQILARRSIRNGKDVCPGVSRVPGALSEPTHLRRFYRRQSLPTSSWLAELIATIVHSSLFDAIPTRAGGACRGAKLSSCGASVFVLQSISSITRLRQDPRDQSVCRRPLRDALLRRERGRARSRR